jgi:YidC/Oxa1 family membrane protein insertase
VAGVIFSVLTPIEDLLTGLLEFLHTSLELPWGWAVVGLTLIVRILIVPVTVRQIHSMQELQAHAPELKALQQRYKHDKVKQREEVMKFYKENRINPAAACLPILFQFPIFIALYFVLRDFEEEVFRPKYPDSDLGWLGIVPDITDELTAHWSGYVLLVIYVASQVASGWFMSAQAQMSQRIMFLILPFIILPFIIDPPGSTVFPVGLLMYWVTTNLWTVGQGLVTRRLIPKPPATPPKRTSRAQAPTEPAPAEAAEEPRASGTAQPRVRRRKKRKGPRSTPRR